MSTVEIIFQPKLYKNESLAQKDKEIALATGHERLVLKWIFIINIESVFYLLLIS